MPAPCWDGARPPEDTIIHDVPNRPKRSPAPLFHVATKAMRQQRWEAYAWFVGAYRKAAEKLKAGDRLGYSSGTQSPIATPLAPNPPIP
jgi:hypothetical protein